MSTVDKPWGHELIWAHTARYVGKILHIRAGEALSLQYHRVKDETIMLLRGRMQLVYFAEGEPPRSRDLVANEPFHITPGLRHRMIALEAKTYSRCPRRSSMTSCGSKIATAAPSSASR